MSFLSAIEADFKALEAKFLTPQNTTAIAGAIASVNIAQPDLSGPAKQSFVAEGIAKLFGIGVSMAHSLVKTVFDTLEKSSPLVLVPVEELARTAANSAVDSLSPGLQAQVTTAAQSEVQKVEAKLSTLSTSPFTQSPPPAATPALNPPAAPVNPPPGAVLAAILAGPPLSQPSGASSGSTGAPSGSTPSPNPPLN